VADRAKARLDKDLSGFRLRERVIFGTEPLVDMMELSGYALLMSRIDDLGIWAVVENAWDGILTNGSTSELVNGLTDVLAAQEDNFALTSGGLGRTSRRMELGRALSARGIVSDFYRWGEAHTEVHADPVVAVFAPDDMVGVHHELADLFIVEFLAQRPGLTEVTLPRGAQALRESIDHRRARSNRPDEGEG
jgi:hypothetical protein